MQKMPSFVGRESDRRKDRQTGQTKRDKAAGVDIDRWSDRDTSPRKFPPTDKQWKARCINIRSLINMARKLRLETCDLYTRRGSICRFANPYRCPDGWAARILSGHDARG